MLANCQRDKPNPEPELTTGRFLVSAESHSEITHSFIVHEMTRLLKPVLLQIQSPRTDS